MLLGCRSFTVVTVLLFIALLPGCGRKTALIPPQKLVPLAINDLRYFLDENGVTLKWSYPSAMENGDELQGIESFEVQRAVISEAEYCDGCPVQYEEPLEIEGGSLPESGETRTAVFTDAYPQNGKRYFYKVRSRAGWWYPSRDSNIVFFVWRQPPEIPQGLQVAAGDGTLTLSWEPVRNDIKGTPLGVMPVYQVYRRNENDNFAAYDETVQEPEFVDTGLVNEKHYSYKVQALVQYDDTLQAGGASRVISGIPSDLTPPPTPQHLVAVEIPAGVKLAWQAVTGDDLAGYRIYRREEKSSVPELITEVGIDSAQYIDRSMPTGKKWFYSVTSFDKAQPANESLPAQEAVIDLQ